MKAVFASLLVNNFMLSYPNSVKAVLLIKMNIKFIYFFLKVALCYICMSRAGKFSYNVRVHFTISRNTYVEHTVFSR